MAQKIDFTELTEEDYKGGDLTFVRRHQLTNRALAYVRNQAAWITKQLETKMAKKKTDLEQRMTVLEKADLTLKELIHHREQKTEERLQAAEQQLAGLSKHILAPQEGQHRRLSQVARENPPFVQCSSCHEVFINDVLGDHLVCPNKDCAADGWFLSPYKG